jgi:hypothetical protein
MEIPFKNFAEIPDVGGFVIMGCDLSTEENRIGFAQGVTDFLAELGLFDKGTKHDEVFSEYFQCRTTGGRTDMVYIFKIYTTTEGQESYKFHIGRMAMARLRMRDCSWIEDWLVNYAKHYDQAPRGRYAALIPDNEDNND